MVSGGARLCGVCVCARGVPGYRVGQRVNYKQAFFDWFHCLPNRDIKVVNSGISYLLYLQLM